MDLWLSLAIMALALALAGVLLRALGKGVRFGPC